MRSAKTWCALVGAGSLLLASCATTRQVQTWKDGAYQGKIKKTLVVATLREPLIRNFMEQEFVAQFKDRGVEGLAANKAIPADVARDKEAALAYARNLGVGTVVVAKILDHRYSDRATGGGSTYMPAGYGVGWDGIYADGWSEVGLPVSQYSVDILTIQMNVYDLQEGKLIFSAVSNTHIEGAPEKVVQPFVETMVQQLAAVKLL
jgi:hypothetical protein